MVESGPYRRIRHPSYSGALLILSGATLTLTNWLSMLALVPFLTYVYRSTVEKPVLKRDLREAHEEYCRRTKRFIFFVC